MKPGSLVLCDIRVPVMLMLGIVIREISVEYNFGGFNRKHQCLEVLCNNKIVVESETCFKLI
jgi:hypothetical protein